MSESLNQILLTLAKAIWAYFLMVAAIATALISILQYSFIPWTTKPYKNAQAAREAIVQYRSDGNVIPLKGKGSNGEFDFSNSRKVWFSYLKDILADLQRKNYLSNELADELVNKSFSMHILSNKPSDIVICFKEEVPFRLSAQDEHCIPKNSLPEQ